MKAQSPVVELGPDVDRDEFIADAIDITIMGLEEEWGISLYEQPNLTGHQQYILNLLKTASDLCKQKESV